MPPIECREYIINLQSDNLHVVWRWEKRKHKERRGGEGGLNYVCFFFVFSYWSHCSEADKVQLLKWCSELNAADKNRQREREREKDTKQLYRFLPQTGSSPVSLALPILWNANNNRVWTLNCCESLAFVCVYCLNMLYCLI